MIPSGSGRCPENRFRPGSRIVHLPGKTGNRITGIRFRPDTRYFCYDGSFSAALRRGRCRAQLFATKERYRCGLPLAGTHRPFFEPILFFLCQKEKNGFNLPRKERGPVRTVVLNLTLKISDSSCPLHQTLPPERSLRSAHRGVRRSQRIWSFRRPGGNGMELASSDAMAARFALLVLHSPLFLWEREPVSFSGREKEMGSRKSGRPTPAPTNLIAKGAPECGAFLVLFL